MLQHTVHALQSELDNLRADNIKLYEKIKFLQSYPGRVSVQLSVCLSMLRLNPQAQELHISKMQLACRWDGEGCSALCRGAETQPPCQEGTLELCSGLFDIF